MSAEHRFSTCGGHLSRMKMPQGVIRTKRKGGGTKGLSRCFMVFRYASIVCGSCCPERNPIGTSSHTSVEVFPGLHGFEDFNLAVQTQMRFERNEIPSKSFMVSYVD